VRLWWNGRWGRIAQRRVRLYHEPEVEERPWRVEAQAGDSEGPTQSWRFACEPDALDWVRTIAPLDQYDIPLICADGSLEIVELKGPGLGLSEGTVTTLLWRTRCMKR